ncbi:hypothetical protein ACFWR9_20730 [Streptomyces sp. NPDC058534]|uniref:hypothetical protein n=1 Tax=Streptomyces sp. NPDC058534 TaxID=3346541 RepID=UPI00365E95EB
MSDALEKAEAAVREASGNTDVLQVAMAALELARAAQQPPATGCGHDHARFDARKWWTIGGLMVVVACVACFLALAFALAATAIAIGGTCATACLLVLRAMWRDFQKGR